MSEQKKRIVWIDVFKGIAILLVVIGHLNTGTVIHNFIYGFHLPAFLFISGMLYKRRDSIKAFIKKDLLKLYVMFLVFAVLWLAFDYVYKFAYFKVSGGEAPAGAVSYLIDSVIALIAGNGNITGVSFGAVWYLIMLAVIRVLYYAIDSAAARIGKNFLKPLICLVLFAVGAALLNGVSNTPYYLSSALTGIAFFMLGDMFKPLVGKVSGLSLGKSLGLTAAVVPLFGIAYFTGSSNLGSNTYDTPGILLISGLFGIMFITGVSLLLSRVGIIEKILSYYGKNSLSVMGWHSEIRICALFLLSLAGINSGLIKNGIVILVTLVLMIPLNIITNKLLKVFDC